MLSDDTSESANNAILGNTADESQVSYGPSTTTSSKKRSVEDELTDGSPPSRIRLQVNPSQSSSKEGKVAVNGKKSKERWRVHRMSDDYVNLVGDIMYPRTEFGPYGYDAEKGRFPIDRINTLGYLLNPIRRPTVIEKWSPYEVALFEASITLYGKNFHQIHKIIKSKNVKEVIEFYYDWKKTFHYKQWKDSYKPDEREQE